VIGPAWYRTVHEEQALRPGANDARSRTKIAAVNMKPGKAYRAADGAVYEVGPDGAIRRTNKPEGTKKQRRKARRRLREEGAK
jgi:hypothetical protein